MLYIYIWFVFKITLSVKLFLVTVQIFVYKTLLTMFFGKRKEKLTKPFTFWLWKHLSKKNHILKMKVHSKKHFENLASLSWKHDNRYCPEKCWRRSTPHQFRLPWVRSGIEFASQGQLCGFFYTSTHTRVYGTLGKIYKNVLGSKCISRQ